MIILTLFNRNNVRMVNNKKIIHLLDKYRNFILFDNNYDYNDDIKYEYRKFKDYYICYFYDDNELNAIRYYNYSHKLHRENGSAFIVYFNGIIDEEYYLYNKLYSYEEYLLEIDKLV